MSHILFNINKNNIKFEKRGNLYSIYYISNYDKKKFEFDTPKLLAPFGAEYFKNKIYINLEIKETTNTSYNLKSIIEQIDDYFKELKMIGPEDVSNLQYYSNLKNRSNNNSLLKTNVKVAKGNILTNIFSDSNIATIDDIIKGSYVKCNIILDSVWIYGNKYGINWVIQDIYK